MRTTGFTLFAIIFLIGALPTIRMESEAPPVSSLNKIRATLPLGDEAPKILIALLVRNKAHVLPLFLTYFERLNYPKNRMALWIRSDHNSDASIDLLELWLNHTQQHYHSVDFAFDNHTKQHLNETSPFEWTETRFRHLIRLKEQALTHAQKIWSDYIFYLDVDVLLTHAETLNYLTGLRLPVVAPMLVSEGLYSNFWCGMSAEYYYLRTEEYKEIYEFHKRGVFVVPMIHSAVLVNLNYMGARYLTFDRERLMEQQELEIDWALSEGSRYCRRYDGPLDDIIVFAVSANCSQLPLVVSNEHDFGYILQPLDAGDSFEIDELQLHNVRSMIVNDLDEVQPINEYFEKFFNMPNKTTLTLSKIFMINLPRRKERRQKMERLFDELGLDVEHFEAVDGRELSAEKLKAMGIQMLNGYEDPYHHRQMTMGEIGCFLSHYRIWERMVAENLSEVLILEDDIRFEPYFKHRAEHVLKQARASADYDLIYFGRKRLKDKSEPWVVGTDSLVHVGYSYWTLGYVISLQGARKLLAVNPLEKLVPVDEFLPIMFDKHPNETLLAAFPERNLLALSSAPLLLYPTHYTGDFGYISDTEDSETTTSKLFGNGGAAAANDSFDAIPQLKSDRELDFAAPNVAVDDNIKSAADSLTKVKDEL